MKPIDIYENQEQLEKSLREWQHRLYLDGWNIIAHITDEIVDPDGKEVADAAGFNTFVFESSESSIQILSKESYEENGNVFKQCMEKILVHELLHCKYAWMENETTYESTYLCAREHQLLEEMAKSLIMAKYGVDYNYFM